MLTVASDYSGIGAFDHALKRISADSGLEFKKVVACDYNIFARIAYLANHGTAEDLALAKSKEHKIICAKVKNIVESEKPPTPEQTIILEQANTFAKQFSFYYPFNVYDREIPETPVDIYCTTPPCQSFSIAGKRLGKEDRRGILFFNSLEFIQKNKPNYFIFENVKGLISHDRSKGSKAKMGKTFCEWLNYLGGLSVNGNETIFPYEEAVPYHIFWKVQNSKKHGVPQNRERVFIIGIKAENHHEFTFPPEEPLTKRLKDVLETFEDGRFPTQEAFDAYMQKYFLSEKMVDYLCNRSANFNAGKINLKDEEDIASCLTKSSSAIDISDNIIKVGNTNPSGKGMNGNIFDSNGISPTLSTNKGEGIKIVSNTRKGYEIATENDSINFSNPNSKTRRGRVGKGVAQTLDTACNQGVFVPKESSKNTDVIVAGNMVGGKWDKTHEQSGRVYDVAGIGATIHTMKGGSQQPKICIPVLTPERLEKRQNGRRFKEDGDEMFTITTQDRHGIYDGYQIRKLTPLECHRLQDFPDLHIQKSIAAGISDSQLYIQAGNSITVRVLELNIRKLLKLDLCPHNQKK